MLNAFGISIIELNDVVVEKFENFLAVDDRGKYIPDHDEALKEMVSLVRKGASS